jgi:hypothetical protein
MEPMPIDGEQPNAQQQQGQEPDGYGAVDARCDNLRQTVTDVRTALRVAREQLEEARALLVVERAQMTNERAQMAVERSEMALARYQVNAKHNELSDLVMEIAFKQRPAS